MSRKGKAPITIPAGVEVTVSNNEVSVKGPKGTLKQQLMKGILIKQEQDQLIISLDEAHASEGNFHGLFRSLIQNMVIGTTQGFERELEMIGVGYRAAIQGQLVDLQIGFSHPTKLRIPEGVTVKIDGKGTAIVIAGADRQKVGQFAATIRAIRPPEPYQGKGIRYKGEYVRKKAGKAAAAKK
jgi:large subunit ribosomal protein L6